MSDTRKEYYRRYYQENKDKYHARNKKWQQDNPTKSKEYRDRYVRENIEKEKARQKKYKDENRERINQKAKEYRANNAAKVKESNRRSKAKNPETILRAYAKRKLLVSDFELPKGSIQKMMAAQKGLCNACGADIRVRRHLDHIVPLVKGGTHDLSNLQLLCVSCNCSKGAKDNVDFLLSLWAG